MALNKRKVLDTARKFAQKGAKAKALKEYNKLLQADPRDAKLLLEVGDAYRRWGQAEEAIAQYSKVAQQYRQDGFDARAVAVFKQILNLDPKHYSAYVALAELYQRMGLDAEAISSLQTAADGYHKEGRKSEALDLLRQMAALDPSNTTSRLKVAELLRQEDMTEEALAEYEAVAGELESQQDPDQLISVFERILEIDPDRLSALNPLVRELMATGALDRAEPLATHALSVSEEPPQYEILMALYAQAGDDAKLADTTRAFAKLYRERGDEENARSLMQRLPNDDVSSQSSSRLAVDVSEVDEPDLGDDDLLEDEPFLTLGDESAEPDFGPRFDAEDELSLEMPIDPPPAPAAVAPAPAPTAPTASSGPAPEGDPDQLLAEASVYLRYGKRDQAISSLQGVLAHDPDHRAALEKLGEAYAEDGKDQEAVAAWCRAAAQIQLANDQDALAVLKDRIAALDPAAAAKIAGPTGPASVSEEDDDGIGEDITETAAPPSEFELDLDLDLDEGIDDSSPLVAPGNEELALDDDAFEIELDDASLSFEPPAKAAKPAAAKPQFTLPETELSFDEAATEGAAEGFEFELDGDDSDTVDSATAEVSLDLNEDVELELNLSEDAAQALPNDPSDSSTTTTEKINDELEEAEFYIGQDMFAEATEILKRVLELVPNHPSAMLRMGEIAAAQGKEPDQAGIGQGAGAKAEAARSFENTARFGEGEELLDTPDAGATTSGLSLDLDVDFDEDDEDDLEAIEVDDSIDLSAPATEPMIEPSVAPEPDPEPVPLKAAEVEAAPEPAEQAEPAVVAVQSEPEAQAIDAGDTFDLREALADVLSDDQEESNADSGVLSTVGDGFESIFSDFKKGVTATLDEGDFDTRYDLGIAYREMGLYEDAIGEFRVCLDSDARRFDSLYLMGLCARDLQRFEDAVNHLEQALAMPDLPTERMAGVYFDLSIAQEQAGDAERACGSLRRVIEIEPGFPGAVERLAALEAGTTTPKLASASEDGFESFDELFVDDDADEDGDAALAEAVPAETFESFDDVVTEAEAEYVDAEMIEGEAILEAEALPDVD